MPSAPKRFFRKLFFGAKIETDYGVSSAPTAAANAIQLSNVTFRALAGEQVQRNLYLPWLGNQGSILTAVYNTMEFDVELAGAGDPGVAPAYGPLLRVCGLSETITADEKVEYQPVSDGFESLTGFMNLDGVNHVMLGVRGNVSMTLTPKGIPVYRFQLWGLLGPIADTPLPTVDLSAFLKPVPVSKAATSLTLHGVSAVAESLQINLGNTVTPRFLIGDEQILISDRQSTGTVVVEQRLIASIDWAARARESTRGALVAQHGATDGNIVMIEAPAVEVAEPTYGQTDGILNASIGLRICSGAEGDDELKITIK